MFYYFLQRLFLKRSSKEMRNLTKMIIRNFWGNSKNMIFLRFLVKNRNLGNFLTIFFYRLCLKFFTKGTLNIQQKIRRHFWEHFLNMIFRPDIHPSVLPSIRPSIQVGAGAWNPGARYWWLNTGPPPTINHPSIYSTNQSLKIREITHPRFVRNFWQN